MKYKNVNSNSIKVNLCKTIQKHVFVYEILQTTKRVSVHIHGLTRTKIVGIDN